jgi:hypothetical protein
MSMASHQWNIVRTTSDRQYFDGQTEMFVSHVSHLHAYLFSSNVNAPVYIYHRTTTTIEVISIHSKDVGRYGLGVYIG